MINSAMSIDEIVCEMQSEKALLWDNVQYWNGKFGKSLNANTKYPISITHEYCTKVKHNRFVITHTARSYADSKTPLGSMYCLYEDSSGLAAVSLNGTTSIYWHHFFERYRERFIKDVSMPIEKVISVYFSRQWTAGWFVITQELEDIYHCFDGHYSDDKVDIVMTDRDGYLFGEKHKDSLVIKTIITDEMLSDRQRELFQALKKQNDNFMYAHYFS